MTTSTPIGEMIDNLKTKMDVLTSMQADVKAVEDEVKQMKADLATRLNSEGMSKGGSGSIAKVFFSTRQTPRITDIEAFQQYVISNQAPYLFQQRLASNAVKELIDMEGDIPGVEVVPITTLNVRKL